MVDKLNEFANDKLDLEAIKAREKKATPGPWHQRIHIVWDADPVEDSLDAGQICKCHYREDMNGLGVHDDIHNAEFIAHAREDIPALVREVERLRKELENRR